MDQQYPWIRPYKHTCTPEELRFGTCKCGQAAPAVSPPEKSSLSARLHQLRAEYERTEALRNQQPAQSIPALPQRPVLLSAGPRIRALRRALGWTQQQAAVELGISKRTVIRYERGQHRRHETRQSLSQRLCELESVHEPRLRDYRSRFGRYLSETRPVDSAANTPAAEDRCDRAPWSDMDRTTRP
jgi:transcriptional regulator with XRE-family HTH domain